ncbi:MAG: SLC13 family permease [Eubacteriales bacterium]|nr:SLC13 family permease [Eubacteriales bacterium]
MSDGVIMLWVLITLALIVIVGIVYKDCNIGLFGIAFAFLIGSWVGGAGTYDIIGYWPTSIMFILIVTSWFFGYASLNGTLIGLADRIVYATRGVPWFSPISVFLTAFMISGLGIGVWGIVFVAPIGFIIARRGNFNPLLVVIATNTGALATGGLQWAAGGPTNTGLLMTAGWDTQEASELAVQFGYASIIPCFVAYLICYFLLKGYKASKVEMEKPVPFTDTQKKTLAVLVFVLLANMLPLVFYFLCPNEMTLYLKDHCNIQFWSVVGAIICMFLKLGDEKEIIAKKIPWNAVILICGVSMLIQVAVQHGLSDVIGNWLNSNFPVWMMPAAFALFGGILSFFCSAMSVVYPLMLPMIYGMVVNGSTVSALACITALILTACYTGMCPFSQNGALMLSSADEETKNYLFYRMISWSVVLMIISVIYALLGGYNV